MESLFRKISGHIVRLMGILHMYPYPPELRVAGESVCRSMERYASNLQQSLISLNSPLLTVGVFGEFNTGKTTFINALLEKSILAAGPLPGTTACAVRIMKNKDRMLEILTDEGKLKRLYNARSDERDRWLAKNLAAGRELVWHDDFAGLPDNLILVDTPGFDALDRRHDAIAAREAEKCDLLLFLSRLDKPLSQQMQEIAKTFSKGKYCIFIGTCADELTEDQLESMRGFFDGRLRQSFAASFGAALVAADFTYDGAVMEGAPEENIALDNFRKFRRQFFTFIEQNKCALKALAAASDAQGYAQEAMRLLQKAKDAPALRDHAARAALATDMDAGIEHLLNVACDLRADMEEIEKLPNLAGGWIHE